MGKVNYIVKAVPSSFVFSNMKLASDKGAGEAKLFVGPKRKEEEIDDFFEFGAGITYRFDKKNMLEYLLQVKMEFVFQNMNHYKVANIEKWNDLYGQIKDIPESEFVIHLSKFVDASRYYIRADEDLFKKIFRKMLVPKITDVVFIKDDETKEMVLFLRINYQFEKGEDDSEDEELEEKNKFRFRQWMGAQVKPKGDSDAGNPYSSATVDQYVSNIANIFLTKDSEKNLFCTSDVAVVQNVMDSLDESEKKNNTQESAVRKYIEFLQEVNSLEDFEDVFTHNLYGIHIKEKNNALSEQNPHICIGWSSLGDLSTIREKQSLIELYEQHFDKNNRGKGQDVGQIWRFINDIQIGDYVIFAENSVFHIGQVESDYYYDNTDNHEQSEDYTNNRKVKWIKKNISRSVLSDNLHNSLKTAMSVWTLNDYKSAVVDLLSGTYVKDEDIEIDESRKIIMKNCLEITRTPRENKIHPINFIVYGAPGTGKTYSMVEYALAIVDNITLDEFRTINSDRKENVDRYKTLVKEGQIVFTTFHQNYGYEEFIQGLRPDKDSDTMAFKTVDGVFKNIADTALNDTEGKNYVIIIDEINRANISKVFGELITLIEEDKRWGELNETSATLQSGDAFAVPNNLYIVGTMNSADKSISLIDAALRRRFDFIEQKPDSSLVGDTVLREMLENINISLVEELDSTDLLVGHSYFMNKSENDLCNILNNNIIPLLYEYFYDNRKKVASLLNDAIKKAGASVEIVDEKVGRLRVKEV